MGKRLLRGMAIGLAVIASLAVAGVALPLLSGYVSWPDRLGNRTIVDKQPVFDRAQLHGDLAAAGFAMGDPVHIRIFKRERRLEVWLRQAATGRYEMFRGYEICRFSGELGPKLKEGDRQAPEGFYRVARAQLNPNSRHHLSFNLGFPNAFDRQHGRTGSALMVHGGCSSVGCYAITDEGIDEVYAMVEAALARGQAAVDVHAFPFRMTALAVAEQGGHAWLGYWRNLKQGYDLFEAERVPPRVAACRGEYRFGKQAEGSDCAPIAAWS